MRISDWSSDVCASDLGYPEPRLRDRGYATLLRTIVGQQVSVAAAASIWRKLEAQVGDLTRPETITHATDEQLRAAGLSRQKAGYARSLADEVTSGALDLDHLPADRSEEHTPELKSLMRISHAV